MPSLPVSLADQFWEVWNAGLTDGDLAAIAWLLIRGDLFFSRKQPLS